MLLRGQNSVESLLDKNQVLLGRSERFAGRVLENFIPSLRGNRDTIKKYIFGLCP